jgi:hypothetical protein
MKMVVAMWVLHPTYTACAHHWSHVLEVVQHHQVGNDEIL